VADDVDIADGGDWSMAGLVDGDVDSGDGAVLEIFFFFFFFAGKIL
jgi:hypothetical protein